MKRLGAAGALLLCLVALPGQASADDPPIAITDVTIAEGAGDAIFTVTGPPDATFDFATSNGTAVAGEDYEAKNVTGAAIPADGTRNIRIVIVDDSLNESDETFHVTLSNPSTGNTIGKADGGGTITDNNDAAPSATIGNAADVTEGNVGGTAKASFTVTLSAKSGREVSVNYATVDGTAKAGEDYAGKSDVLKIAAGQLTGTVVVNVTGDTKPEADETFSVILTQRDGASIGEPHQGTAKILDDDAKPKLSIGDASVIEGSDPAKTVDLKFTLKLTVKSDRAVTVRAATQDDAAVAALDYEPKSETVTFKAGELEAFFTVRVKGDTLDEENENFLVVLSSPDGVDLDKAVGLGTILDDDHRSMLAIGDATADEPTSGSAAMKFTVTLSPASARTVRVNFATADGTASAPSDYAAAGGTLVFGPGQTQQEVTITVQGDQVNEDNETIIVNLSGASGALVSDAQGHGTIIDKNAPPSLSIDDTLARESEGATFTVTLAGTTFRTVTVGFGTSDGTAKEGTDYVARRGTLTFAPGEKTKTVSVTVLDDALPETSETFSVTLGDPLNATITKSRGTATIESSDQIATPSSTNNKPPPTVKPKPATPAIKLPRMVLAPSIVKVTRAGVIRLQVTCSKLSPVTCAGSVGLETATKPVIKLGSKRFSVRKGKQVILPIKLSPQKLRLLKKQGKLRARAVVMVKVGTKTLRVVPGVITLTAPKPVAKAKAVPTPAP
jgi:Calx-beta domain-containing protein